MGSPNGRPRKKQQRRTHLPKVDSRSYSREDQSRERRAVLGNLGLRGGGGGMTRIVTWVLIVVIVLGLTFGAIGWLFL